MDEFCGDVSNAWGISAKGYLTHCFDDLVLFGATYIFIFVAGSYRTWTLLHVPPVTDFPYSTRHSIKVLVLGWLGLFPIVLFVVKYADGIHDDFEWVAKPLGSVAWLFSLWLLNMEVARDLRECWILKVFWASSAIAGTVALPTVILAAQTNGYGMAFYIYLLHFVLYAVICVLVFRFPHTSAKTVPEFVGFAGAEDELLEGEAKTDEGGDAKKNETPLHHGFLTALWRRRFIRMLGLFAPERLFLAAAFVCLCGGVAFNGLALVILGRLFNNFYYPYSPDSARGHMREYCLALIVAYLLSSAFDAAQTTLIQLAGERMASRTRRKLLHNLLRQEMAYFDRMDPGQLVKILQVDVAAMQRTLGDHIFHGVHCILNFAVAVSIMFLISWKMSLVVLSLSPVCMLVIGIQRFYACRLGQERSAAMHAASLLVTETLRHLREVRSMAAEARQLDKYKDLATDLYDLSLQSGMVNATSKSSATLMVQLAVALSLYLGGLAVLTRQVEVGYVITFAAVSIMSLSSLAQVSPLVAQITKALRITTQVIYLLDRSPRGAAATAGGQTLDGLEGRIEFHNVTFGIDVEDDGAEGLEGLEGLLGRRPEVGDKGRVPLLHGFALTISAGSMTGIVQTGTLEVGGGGGRAGSGREGLHQTSAIMSLIQRLYDPLSGSVLLDGHDLRTLDSEWLRENVAVVHQEPVLLGMTIAQNIAFSRETASQAQVEAAARFANAHDFIQTIPDGYQALIGDTGVRLTGPQRLQVGLARAILAPAKILILDETLSGLDDQSALVVLGNLRRELAGSRTVIALTSLPQSLRGAFDSIALVHEGQVVEQGSSQQHISARWQHYTEASEGFRSLSLSSVTGSGSGGGAVGGHQLEEQTSTMSSLDSEAVWHKRLAIADQLEDSILQLGVQQGKVMDLVETVTEIKEALALEASSAALR